MTVNFQMDSKDLLLSKPKNNDLEILKQKDRLLCSAANCSAGHSVPVALQGQGQSSDDMETHMTVFNHVKPHCLQQAV